MGNKISPAGLTLIVLGAVLGLKLFGLNIASYEKIYTSMLLFYGFVAVYIHMGREKRGGLFLGIISFMAGVLLYTQSNFDLMTTNRIILPSIFFILCAACLFLYFDNFKEKLFLYVSLILFLLGIISLNYYDSFEPIRFSASISRTVFNLWPYLFVIVGIGVLTDKRK